MSRTRARSLGRDLALGLGLGIAALWLVAMAASWFVLRAEVDEIYDAALARTAEWMLAAPAAPGGAPPPEARGAEGMIYARRAPGGEILARSAGAEAEVFAGEPAPGFRDAGGYRVYGARAPDGSLIEVADPLSERREATREALGSLLVAAAALVPVILFGVAAFVAAALRPLRRFAAELARRDTGNLAPVDAPGLPAELLPVEEAVNRLMDRIAAALEAEHAFSANAAHELRTPIAAALAQTQRLLAEAPEGPLRARATAIEAELRRMARLAEKLLDLARAEGAGAALGETADLRPVLTLVLADLRGGAGVRLDLPETAVPAAMHADAFAILARNLIENALLHGAAPVEVALDAGGRFSVTSAGPPIAPEALPRLTRRFERLGARHAGSGLGLAIVETLARAAGAALDFRSPAPGRTDGLRVTVALPARRPG